MKFTVLDCAQRSPEWYRARSGRLTSSNVSEIFEEPRKDRKERAGRRNLRIKLALERITNRSLEADYQSFAMRQGLIREAEALAVYEAITGQLVRRTGFLTVDECMVGCSLDGHIGKFVGIIEAKCPTPGIHLGYLKTGKVPDDYLRQIHHQLWISGARWCDWLSYCPEFPETLQTRLTRIEAKPEELAAHELYVRQFLREVENEYAEVMRMSMEAVK